MQPRQRHRRVLCLMVWSRRHQSPLILIHNHIPPLLFHTLLVWVRPCVCCGGGNRKLPIMHLNYQPDFIYSSTFRSAKNKILRFSFLSFRCSPVHMCTNFSSFGAMVAITPHPAPRPPPPPPHPAPSAHGAPTLTPLTLYLKHTTAGKPGSYDASSSHLSAFSFPGNPLWAG